MSDNTQERSATTPVSPTMSVARPHCSTPDNHSVSSDASLIDLSDSLSQSEPRLTTEPVPKDIKETLKTITSATEALLPMIDILAGVCHDLGALAPYLTDLGHGLRRNAAHLARAGDHTENTIFDPEPAASHDTSDPTDSRKSSFVRQRPIGTSDEPSTSGIAPDKKPLSKLFANTGTPPTLSKTNNESSESDESSGSSIALMTKRQKTNPVESSVRHETAQDRKEVMSAAPAVPSNGKSHDQIMEQEIALDKPAQVAPGVYPHEYQALPLPPLSPRGYYNTPRPFNTIELQAIPNLPRRFSMQGSPTTRASNQDAVPNRTGSHAAELPGHPPVFSAEVGISPQYVQTTQGSPLLHSQVHYPSLLSSSADPYPISPGLPGVVNPYQRTTWPDKSFATLPSRDEIRRALNSAPNSGSRRLRQIQDRDLDQLLPSLEQPFSHKARK
ncbi:uncharacterized protein LDX57_008748 [Aspergillus melleus]|uniref:uncharacterized protein n=1 Tax=Aspergillus melleus TaxID=138277 RepID=UPI001E8E1B06|nr:uncharacterized protein LDX57_008748 [Aspergillus melleus]KAH8431087.1 hypothetical protein LDX57_008748 [Aspergillus melleus]